MTIAQRISALEPLGFTSRQTKFVVMAALHGGYCLRRQYTTFANLRYGKTVRDFLDTLVERNLAQRMTFQSNRGYVHHLHSKSLYRRIGQAENRNRRHASAALIARKLMVLDFVLTRPDAEWYATEQDKVELFTGAFQVPLADLPRRVFAPRGSAEPATTRYFIDKLPIVVIPESSTPCFVYLVIDRTGQGLTQFLVDHVRLFARLPSWRVVAIGPPPLDATGCRRVFDRFVADAWRPVPRGQMDDLRWLCTGLQAVERRNLRSYSVADLDRLRTLRREYSGPWFQALYSDWCARGESALAGRSDPPSTESGTRGLITCSLDSSYSQFGSLPGVA